MQCLLSGIFTNECHKVVLFSKVQLVAIAKKMIHLENLLGSTQFEHECVRAYGQDPTQSFLMLTKMSGQQLRMFGRHWNPSSPCKSECAPLKQSIDDFQCLSKSWLPKTQSLPAHVTNIKIIRKHQCLPPLASLWTDLRFQKHRTHLCGVIASESCYGAQILLTNSNLIHFQAAPKNSHILESLK